jgi:starvation-inducible outer membrane lipoprotein
MKKIFLLIVLSFSATVIFAQKKLVPVAQSALTGISLPAGSMQDSRMLSVAAAKMLRDRERKKTNTTLSVIEVFSIPTVGSGGLNAEMLAKRLTDLGWTISGCPDDKQYAWILKGSNYLLMFFSMNARMSDLYFSVASPVPQQNAPISDPGNATAAGMGTNPAPQAVDTAGQHHTGAIFSQNEAFDIVTYASPKGWQKEGNENIVSYLLVDKTDNSWCRIAIAKSTLSKGSIEQDFESEWNDLAAKPFKIDDAPHTSEISEADGWKIRSGSGKFTFNNANAAALLTTFSGYGRCVSIIATTGNQRYLQDIENFVSHVELKKPDENSVQSEENDNSSIIGTWGISNTYNQQSNDLVVHVMGYGYTTNQYTFNSNNEYSFVSKTFLSSDNKMLLVRENGSYLINGNNITINPLNSVIESWSKKDSVDKQGRPAGVDKWGKLLSSQKRTLEKVTYQFTKHYFSGIQLWNLVLQANTATKRDGPYSSNTTFSNAWYYSPISNNNPQIELPEGQNITTEEIRQEPVQQPSTGNNTAILGTWCISASDQSNFRVKNGVMSTIFRQYTFKENGIYGCNIKTFDPLMNSILLGRESGSYQINGNNLTINPQKSVLEEWSKKDGRDEWGKLLKTQNITIEKVTYQFTKQYISEISEWQLVLKANNQTKRDGPFNNNEGNAWIYIIASPSHPVIKLPN